MGDISTDYGVSTTDLMEVDLSYVPGTPPANGDPPAYPAYPAYPTMDVDQLQKTTCCTRVLRSKITRCLLFLIFWVCSSTVFMVIEEHEASREQVVLTNHRRNVSRKIIALTNANQALHLNSTETTEALLQTIDALLLKHSENLYHEFLREGVNANPVDTGSRYGSYFKWAGSMGYMATVFTTIGYGHVTPTTAGGKFITFVVAVFGIPVLLFILIDLGSMHARCLIFMCSLINKRCGFTHSEGSYQRHVISKYGPIVIGIATLVIFVVFGGFLLKGINEHAGWSFGDAVWFILVTITTIGFGDMYVEDPSMFLVSMLYALEGLSLVSMLVLLCNRGLKKRKNNEGIFYLTMGESTG